MLKKAFLLLALCSINPAQAGLFSDDDARKQIQIVQERVDALTATEQEHQKQLTQSILDLQTQIDTMSGELRKALGRNEELENRLQSSEKRVKDFYLDVDSRLRRFESTGAPASGTNQHDSPVVTGVADVFDPATENRALETGYGLLRGKSYLNAVKAFKDFMTRYPDSVQIPNAIYGLGNAYYGVADYKNALMVYENFLKDYPNTPRAPDVLLNVAGCHQGLRKPALATKTLKQLVSKYPDSSAAMKAKQQLEERR